jgi:hypothetical protein
VRGSFCSSAIAAAANRVRRIAMDFMCTSRLDA